MLSIKEYYHKIHNDVIAEAFQCKLLSELNKQFNMRIHANSEDNEWPGNIGKDVQSTFKRIFAHWDIEWDKITEDMVIKCSSDNKEDVKKARIMMSNRANSGMGMIILTNKNKNSWPKYTGALIKIHGEIRYYSFITDSEFRSDTKKLNELEHCLSNTFYMIDLTNLMAREKQRIRMKQKEDSDYYTSKEGRDNLYKRILDENKKRYREYTEKIKAQKQANDGVPEKVDEYLNKVTSLLATMAKDPIKYAQFDYDISTIMELLNGKKQWHQPKKWNEEGYYYGIDGLLTIYKTYVKYKLTLAKGSASTSDAKSFNDAKANLKTIFDTIDKKLSEINQKMAA